MLTILIPTYEEKNNIQKIVYELYKILHKIKFKIIFIDDNSQDDSLSEFKKIKKLYTNVDYIIRKEKDRDLTLSFLLGLSNVKTEYVCLTDCDLQHDIKKIPLMLSKIVNQNYDLVIGSRFKNRKEKVDLNFYRLLNSRVGILLSKLIGIKDIFDPLSGFFIFKTKILRSTEKKIFTKGFKILLTILFLTKNKINVYEIETEFFSRKYGKSKLNFKTKINFLKQIITLFFYKNT